MSDLKTKKKHKLGVIGNGSVGKTSLILRFISGEYVSQYDPTISDSYYKSFIVDDIMEQLDIEDTSGQEEYWEHIQDPCIQESDAFLVVYDVTTERATDDVKFFLDKIKRIKNDANDKRKVPVIIVGNKSDLKNKRKITYDAGTLLATQNNDDRLHVNCIETSAKEDTNVDKLFCEIVKMIRNCDALNDNVLIDKHNSVSDYDTVFTINADNCKFSCNIGNICCNSNQVSGRANILTGLRLSYIKNNPKLRINEPLLSLKPFMIKSEFDCGTFMKAMGCSIVFPVVIIGQTIAFLVYTERRQFIVYYYPKKADYSLAKYGIIYDFLGLIVGRKPKQDPEAPKNIEWFLRQTMKQKIVRVILMIVVIICYFIIIHNGVFITDDSVAIMEALGPLILYFTLWILFASYIAYQPKVEPSFGLAPKLRSFYLSFGDDYANVVTVYTFLRLYYKCINDASLVLSITKIIIIAMLSLIYALIPILVRQFINDTFTRNIVILNGTLANFMLSFAFIYSIEAVYAKSFGNYQKWMTDFTLLLSKKKTLSNNENLFLSLTINSNAQAWLECRSFLAIEGKLLFAKQQIPTLYMIIIVVSLSIYLLYRVFIIQSNPLLSITFNGAAIFDLICIGLLARILITGYAFAEIQSQQEKLLSQQSYFVNCSPDITGVTNDDESKDTESKTNESETKPIVNTINDDISISTKINILRKMSFIDKTLEITKQKDIYPRLFGISLSNVLPKTLIGVTISLIISLLKVIL